MAVVEDCQDAEEPAGQGEQVKGSCGDLVERLHVPQEYGDAFKASTIRESSSTLLIHR
jgi:hypothetical protein